MGHVTADNPMRPLRSPNARSVQADLVNPMDLPRLAMLKEKVATLQREADRAQGALSQALERLKHEYDCESVEAAERVLERMRKKVGRLEREYEEAQDAFSRKWAEVLK